MDPKELKLITSLMFLAEACGVTDEDLRNELVKKSIRKAELMQQKYPDTLALRVLWWEDDGLTKN